MKYLTFLYRKRGELERIALQIENAYKMIRYGWLTLEGFLLLLGFHILSEQSS